MSTSDWTLWSVTALRSALCFQGNLGSRGGLFSAELCADAQNAPRQNRVITCTKEREASEFPGCVKPRVFVVMKDVDGGPRRSHCIVVAPPPPDRPTRLGGEVTQCKGVTNPIGANACL